MQHWVSLAKSCCELSGFFQFGIPNLAAISWCEGLRAWEKLLSEWLESCGVVECCRMLSNVSMMQLVKWTWLTPRLWLSRTCFLNSSWRFLNIISFSCEVLQGRWHSKMPNSQPYLQQPSTSFFRFLPQHFEWPWHTWNLSKHVANILHITWFVRIVS